MQKVSDCPVPADSLLAQFGDHETDQAQDYRDCFTREVPGEIALPQFVERFYSSAAFLPERLLLRLIAGPSSRADARALALGQTDRFGAWKLVERRTDEMLLSSKATGTASWFKVEPSQGGTRLFFGSWVGAIGTSGWNSLLRAHVWYSRALLAAV